MNLVEPSTLSISSEPSDKEELKWDLYLVSSHTKIISYLGEILRSSLGKTLGNSLTMETKSMGGFSESKSLNLTL